MFCVCDCRGGSLCPPVIYLCAGGDGTPPLRWDNCLHPDKLQFIFFQTTKKMRKISSFCCIIKIKEKGKTEDSAENNETATAENNENTEAVK